MGKVLVIVDVQKEFDEYIQHDLVDSLSKYAEKFDKVYQIWDTHNGTVAPTHSFPNQIDSIPKKYGNKHFNEKVKKFIKKIEDSSEEGRTFKLKDEDGYIVRIKNNHHWFYVNPEIVELIEKIKNDKIILAGGADGECLEDVYQSFKALGLKVHINKKYTYSAKTKQEDSIQESNNDKDNASEIAVLVRNFDEYEKLNSEIPKINLDYFISFIDNPEIEEYPFLIFYNFVRKDTSWITNYHYEINIHYDLNTIDYMNNVYNKIYTLDDLETIKNILEHGSLRYDKPNFISYKPRKLIYENNLNKSDNYEVIFFKPNTDDEVVKAQEIALKLGYGWGYNSLEKFLQYTNTEESHILLFNTTYRYILRIPEIHYENDIHKFRNIEDFLKDNAATESFILTEKLSEFRKLIGDKPTYKPRKMVYENKLSDYKYDKLVIKINDEEEFEKIKEYIHDLFNDKVDYQGGFYLNIEYPNYIVLSLISLNFNDNIVVRLFKNEQTSRHQMFYFINTVNNREKNTYDPEIITIDNLEQIKNIKETGNRIKYPDYKPRKMIYENNIIKPIPRLNESRIHRYDEIIYKPKTLEDSIEAQKFALKNDYVWGGGSNEIKFDKDINDVYLMFFETNDKKILRTPKNRIERDFRDYQEYINNVKEEKSFFTEDLYELKSKISNIPSYKPRKLIR